jgi:hypothetical protein
MDQHFEHEVELDDYVEPCYHIAIVSCSESEVQCMDCLRIWPKNKGFKSDFPQCDRG